MATASSADGGRLPSTRSSTAGKGSDSRFSSSFSCAEVGCGRGVATVGTRGRCPCGCLCQCGHVVVQLCPYLLVRAQATQGRHSYAAAVGHRTALHSPADEVGAELVDGSVEDHGREAGAAAEPNW